MAERDRKIAELKEMEAKLVIAEDYIILQQNSLREGEAKLAEIIVFHDRAVEAVKKLEANLVQEKGKLAHAVEEKERMKEELRKYADAEAALQQMEASLRN